MIDNPYQSPEYAELVDESSEPEDRWEPNPDQAIVDRMLIRGIVFTIIWILGFGSLYAVYLGFRAHQMIRESEGELHGMGKVWWCYLVGGFGVAWMVITLAVVKMNG